MTEQKALTCFTIDAILNKTNDKQDYNADKNKDVSAAVHATGNVGGSAIHELERSDKFKTDIRSEISVMNDNSGVLQSLKTKFSCSSSGTTSPSPSFEKNQDYSLSHQRPSRDSGVFLENDLSPFSPHIPARNLFWMPPCVTPLYPLYPVPFCDVSPTTSFASGLSLPYGNLPFPFGYFMENHNVCDLKLRAWDS